MAFTRTLIEFFNHSDSYNTLFTPTGGYLTCEGGKWAVSRKKPSDFASYYSELAKRIVEEIDLSELPQPEEFALRFNSEWTKKCFSPSRDALSDPEDAILFNSKSATFRYLSNFFPTLIFLKVSGQKGDTALSKFYFCLETAYITARAAALELNRAKELSRSTEPVKAKAAMQALADEKTERITDGQKVQLMQKLLHKKFDQNPLINGLLLQTEGRGLIENTSSHFWGRGADGEGENHLGRLLMELRVSNNR